jgi:hypothetical protein
VRRIFDDLAFARSTAECSIDSMNSVERFVVGDDAESAPITRERMEGSEGLGVRRQLPSF